MMEWMCEHEGASTAELLKEMSVILLKTTENGHQLSELQKIIVGGLKLCGLPQEDIVATMLLLQTEDQQWKMADYLETVIDDPPSKTEIFKTAAELAKSASNA